MSDSNRGHILLYTDRPGIYGTEQCNHALICAFADAGYRTTFVQPIADHYLIAEREQRGILHKWLQPDDIYDLRRSARTLTDEEEPRRILSSARPDLILFSDSCPLSNLKAKQAAHHLQIPYITVIHCVNIDWVTEYASYLPELPATYRRAQAVIAVSQANLDLLHELFELPEKLGQVIHNGRPAVFFDSPTAASRRRTRQALSIPEDAIVCLTVARLEFSKGYQYQLDALVHLRRCPSWPRLIFLWVGSGTLGNRLQTYVKLLQCQDKVKFLGERTDVPDLLDSADMFLLPSQFEGMPLGVMEAMAKGLPVAATAVSGTAEALGNCGQLLADPRQAPAMPQEMAEVICNWARHPVLRREKGKAGRQRALNLFQEEQMVDAYLALVESYLERNEN